MMYESVPSWRRHFLISTPESGLSGYHRPSFGKRKNNRDPKLSIKITINSQMTKCVQYEFDHQPHLHPLGNSVTAGNCREGQCVQLMTSDCSCALANTILLQGILAPYFRFWEKLGFCTKNLRKSEIWGPPTSQLLLLGKLEYGGGPIFKVVLEC